MNKRDFLKYMGMAPVAAPMIANSVVDAVKASESETGSMFGYKEAITAKYGYPTVGYPMDATPYNKQEKFLGDLKYWKERLSSINSGSSNEATYVVTNEIKASFYVDSLRSVSKSVKLIMMQKEKDRLLKIEEISNAQNHINNLTKELGILGYIFGSEE